MEDMIPTNIAIIMVNSYYLNWSTISG